MSKQKWKARTKRDLMIEVWEHLDCESVGARELQRIADEAGERFGAGAIESPAAIARLLADEGAELRHAEVLDLDTKWRSADPYQAVFRNVLKFSDFEQTVSSIKRMENLRRQFERTKDDTGIRLLRELALKGRSRAQMISRNPSVEARKRQEKAEIADWFTVWLRTPELFDDWLDLRRKSKPFQEQFAE
ncbi:MAG: hypothetical protein WKF84_20255 [Pyrinomonadaceae bacterium]